MSIGDKGHYAVNLDDEVVRGALVTRDSEVLWPAPRPAAPPVAAAAPPKAPTAAAEDPKTALTPWQQSVRAVATTSVGMGTVLGLGAVTGPAFMTMFNTLGLASLIGFRAVWNVAPALHSPLMCK